MTYTSATRDRYRLAVWTTTAAVTAGAISATGWVAGAAAHDHAGSEAARQAEQDAQASEEYAAWLARYGDQPATRTPRTVLRQRPVRTRVSTRYVTAASPATVGPGGTVATPSAPAATSSQAQAPSPAQTQAPSQPTATPPPPPPPPPPPTPTSGS